ncbi:hypothetical protein PBT90_19580 [Algoriphagus halophytocola]|uniref:Tetratricopeptide repeat protein n=1 Tax=Algoriphagus halophytocola TaxID=2991499 RepID=A0ABY6MEX5_9BACT|nr:MULTISPECIES: hypothetical protein [unclassified Algoriphagus]UZD21718.1 hypothetical protein OM944_13715 [Algoriphagus sp. TR-M5]WBL42930.1 hypothetical protein PBT90_19580 [Algoriphagus sp. TR-M9]
MESITELLDTCTLPERYQMVEYAKVKNAPNSKKLQLLQLYVQEPGLSDSDYSKKIYNKENIPAFHQLKKRVKEECEDLLILLKPSCIEKENKIHIQCTELLLKSQLVLARGLRDEGVKLLERGLRMAINNRFHDLVLTVYSTVRRFELSEIIHHQDLPDLQLAIKSHLQLLMDKYNYRQTDTKPAENSLLKTMIQQVQSSRTSWGQLEKINAAIDQKNYELASELVIRAENSPQKLFQEEETKNKLVKAKLSIYLNKGEFTQLRALTGQLLDGVAQQPNNFYLYEYHWLALFHLGRLDEAAQLLKRQLPKVPTDFAPRWLYFEFYLLFCQQSYKIVLRRIHEHQNKLKSEPHLYLGSKMLELMVLIEQNEQDWLEYKMENMRKLISRKKKAGCSRIQAAFQVFWKMQKTKSSDSLIEDPSFLSLVKGEKNFAWEPGTFELIRYEEWMAERFKLPA